MSTMMHPRGPRPASVYWRRRLALLSGFLAVLVVGWLAFGGGGTDGASAQGNEPNPPAGGSPSPTPDPDPGTSSSPEPSAGQSSAAAKSPTVDCRDSDIAVVVAIDKDTYPAGTNPHITMTISSHSEADCVRDIGSAANEIKITSGGHHVWSSNDCDTSEASSKQVLSSGAEAQVSLTWERNLSAPGCPKDAGDAEPGSYQVQGSNGQVVSDEVTFVLE